MATTEQPVAAEAPPGLPDYVLNSNAVLKDVANWRFGGAPDYTNTRRVFNQSTFILL